MARNRKPENRGRLPQYNPSEDDTESFNVSKCLSNYCTCRRWGQLGVGQGAGGVVGGRGVGEGWSMKGGDQSMIVFLLFLQSLLFQNPHSLNSPGGGVVSSSHFGLKDPGFESCWRWSSVHDSTALHCRAFHYHPSIVLIMLKGM